MADETPTPQAPPVKAKAASGKEKLVARLMTAGSSDEFRILANGPEHSDDDLVLTHEGVEVSPQQAEMLLEIAAQNGVAISIDSAQEGK